MPGQQAGHHATARDPGRLDVPVSVSYTGRPGVHNDGDGTTEGWFRSRDGGFVTTEPVGSEDWMPLNDYPAAKPTYDFYDTVGTGLTGVANGILVSRTPHGPGAEFAHGSVTWHWHMRSPVASYLVEDSIGRYRLTERTADNGIRFYQAQDGGISAKQQAKNRAIMSMQQNITEFESQFSGSFPFSSDGVIIGTPPASFEEEMETMITFSGGVIDTDTLYHENMHQWWGDNVTEGGYAMTFYKEGLATLAEYLYAARRAETAAGGPYSAKGQAAFQASLVQQFKGVYGAGGTFWTLAPSNPTPYSLFDEDPTRSRASSAGQRNYPGQPARSSSAALMLCGCCVRCRLSPNWPSSMRAARSGCGCHASPWTWWRAGPTFRRNPSSPRRWLAKSTMDRSISAGNPSRT